MLPRGYVRPFDLPPREHIHRDFCGFLVATGLCLSQVSHVILLAFMEFLLQNAITSSNIANYKAGLRASFILYNINMAPFQNQQLQYFHKAAKLQIQTFPKTKVNVDEYLLTRIITVCDSLEFPFILKPLYLLAIFSFLRISNILPHAITSFDPTYQLNLLILISSFSKVGYDLSFDLYFVIQGHYHSLLFSMLNCTGVVLC